MERSKIRKLLKTLPPFMPPATLERALGKISNGTARAKVRARYHRRDAR